MAIDDHTLHNLLVEFVKGEIQVTNKGFKICCPWHNDVNPSCVVFFKTGNFHCFVCHGDQPKGHRGISAYNGFLKLGMDTSRAWSLFLSKKSADTKLDTSRLPSLDTGMCARKVVEQVVSREVWPQFWGFRQLAYKTLTASWFVERFSPEIVNLKKERHPRIAVKIGGVDAKQEVYLRLNSAVKAKAINTSGLTLDPDSDNHAKLFGLVGNKLKRGCRMVFIVEGPYDGMHLLQHCYQLGLDAEVISILGTPHWLNCFKQIQLAILDQMVDDAPFVLAFDNDAAGLKITKSAIASLLGVFFPEKRLQVLNYPLSIKDPGDLPYDVFCQAISKLNF